MSAVASVTIIPTLEQLIARRVDLKRAADKAAEPVKEIDKQIVDMLREPGKTEGSVTKRAGDFKVTATFKVNRAVDTDALKANWSSLTENVQSAFKWSADVAVANLRELEEREIKIASKYFETKPASTGLKIELA